MGSAASCARVLDAALDKADEEEFPEEFGDAVSSLLENIESAEAKIKTGELSGAERTRVLEGLKRQKRRKVIGGELAREPVFDGIPFNELYVRLAGMDEDFGLASDYLQRFEAHGKAEDRQKALDALKEAAALKAALLEALTIVMKCSIKGNGGNNVLNGTPKGEVICGKDGNDRVNGGGGNDIVIGGAGNDKLKGGGGNDILDGGKGNDKGAGGKGNDILDGDEGKDSLGRRRRQGRGQRRRR